MQGPPTGRLQPVLAVGLPQTLDALTGPQSLLWVATIGYYLLNAGLGFRPLLVGPLTHTVRRPTSVLAMRFGHVFRGRRVPSLTRAAWMTGYPFPAVQTFHDPFRGPHVELPPRQSIRYRVMMFLEGDMIVLVHPDLRPFGKLVGPGWQGLEGRLVQLFEVAPAAPRQLLEGTVIESLQMFPDDYIEFTQGQELPIAQRSENPALGYTH